VLLPHGLELCDRGGRAERLVDLAEGVGAVRLRLRLRLGLVGELGTLLSPSLRHLHGEGLAKIGRASCRERAKGQAGGGAGEENGEKRGGGRGWSTCNDNNER